MEGKLRTTGSTPQFSRLSSAGFRGHHAASGGLGRVSLEVVQNVGAGQRTWASRSGLVGVVMVVSLLREPSCRFETRYEATFCSVVYL